MRFIREKYRFLKLLFRSLRLLIYVTIVLLFFIPVLVQLLDIIGKILGYQVHWTWIDLLIKKIGVFGVVLDPVVKRYRYGWLVTILFFVGLIIYKRWAARLYFFLFSKQKTAAMVSLHENPSYANNCSCPYVWKPLGNLKNSSLSSSHAPPSDSGDATPLKSWEDQIVAMEALKAWLEFGVGNGRWGKYGIWPCQPDVKSTKNWLPLSVSIITGANGVGKSQLSIELSHYVARTEELGLRKITKSESSKHVWSPTKRTMKQLQWWFRRALPFTNRATDDPWDVGIIHINTTTVVEDFKTWEPRRPTFLVIDEPCNNVGALLNCLSSRRRKFWNPVRVLILDQVIPLVLNDLTKSNDILAIDLSSCEHGNLIERAQQEMIKWERNSLPPMVIFFNGVFNLGELRFSEEPIRRMWFNLTINAQNQTELRLKLCKENDFFRVKKISEGNPLFIYLLLSYLIDHPSESIGGLCKKVSSNMRIFLQKDRAARLKANYEAAFKETNNSHKLLQTLAASTLCGGMWLQEELKTESVILALKNVFPERGFYKDSERAWIPPIRPKSVGYSFIESLLDPKNTVERAEAHAIARLAWQHNPEGVLNALRSSEHIPSLLHQEVKKIAMENLGPMKWAQVCCDALLYDNRIDDSLLDSIAVLTKDDLETFIAWLRERFEQSSFRTPSPIAALIVISYVIVALHKKDYDVQGQEIISWYDSFITWVDQAKNDVDFLAKRSKKQSALRRAFLTALAEMMVSILYRSSDQPSAFVCISESSEFLEKFNGYNSRWRMERHDTDEAIWYASEMDRISILQPEFPTHAGIQAKRASAWQLVAGAASRFGGELAFEKAEFYAKKVEEIATAQSTFATDPGIQAKRASAWELVVYAASGLGGELAFEKSEFYAKKVEEIVTAQSTFATDPGIQESMARAWANVVVAAVISLDIEMAFKKSEFYAKKVERIATAQSTFDKIPEMQLVQALAWQFVAFAASRLGGEFAVEKSEFYANKIEGIATAQSELEKILVRFIQLARIVAWKHVTFAASNLSEEKAYEKSITYAMKVEKIATSQRNFIKDPYFQREKEKAWELVTLAATRQGIG